jgi:hypothetical protein
VIPPGGEAEIEVTLTPKGTRPEIEKRIVVLSDDPENSRFTLTMKGELVVDVRANPSTVNFRDVRTGEKGSKELELKIRKPDETKLSSVVVEDKDYYRLEELEGSKPEERRYVLHFKGSKKVGSFTTRILVESNSEESPLRIPVRARVVSNLRYTKRMSFVQKDGTYNKRLIRFTARDGVAPKLRKIVDPDGLLVLEKLDPKDGRISIKAQVDEKKLAKLDDEARAAAHYLYVHTNDPDEPKVELIYTIRDKPRKGADGQPLLRAERQ